MRQPTCFIASAFGYSDVDNIYDKSIISILRELGVKPLRVDKIIHNDRIDTKIIRLIYECDFGIADLSYARPSVYFEAGLIEGMGKQVIYIVRKDHFKPKSDDIFGNERIHFDLLTKNIIDWTQPNKLFSSKLKKRINLILKTVNAQLKDRKNEIESKNNFNKLSLNDRIKLLEVSWSDYIRKKKLKPLQFRFIENVFGNRSIRLQFEVTENLTQNDLIISSHKSSEISNHYQIKTIRVFCTLNHLPKKRIEHALRIVSPISDNVFQYKTITYIFWDKIDSEYKLQEKLKKLTLI
jgi:hypothetical protein